MTVSRNLQGEKCNVDAVHVAERYPRGLMGRLNANAKERASFQKNMSEQMKRLTGEAMEGGNEKRGRYRRRPTRNEG
jgi:hypothetical protein